MDNSLSRRSRAASVRDERAGERGPAGLVRRTETFAGIAVEVFVEEEVVAPRGIALEGAQTRLGGGTKMKHAVVGIRGGARISAEGIMASGHVNHTNRPHMAAPTKPTT